MICYKDVNKCFISQITGQRNSLDDLLIKPAINFEPGFDDDHIPSDDIIYQKLFYQIDSTWLFNPNRDLILSTLESFDRFCDAQFPVSIYPFYIYQQIIKIGIERIQDFQIVSKVLSISLYICSSKDKNFILNLEIFPLIYKILNFFNEIQLEMQSQLNKQVYNNELATIVHNYTNIFDQAVFFLKCLESFYDKNDDELKKSISLLINIILTNFSINQNNQEINSSIDFSRVFDFMYSLIPVFHFIEDEMIPINHFFIEFLEKTKLNFFESSFLKAVYRTKSWHFNVFNIFNNDIFIEYIKNCFLFINQGIEDETIKQNECKYQDLVYLMKFLFKSILKVDLSFPEIYEIKFEALNGPSQEILINNYLKCIEKNLKNNIFPSDLISLFHFSFDCFLNCEFKIQKSSIGLISQLSKHCIDKVYQNIIERLNLFFSFVESGNVEITKYILIILINIIEFCSINDQNSFNILLDEITGQNVLQIVSDSLCELDKDNIEIIDLSRCIEEHIQKYQSKI